MVGGRYGTQYIYSFGTIVNEWMYVKNLLSHKSRTIFRYRMEIYEKRKNLLLVLGVGCS